MLAEHEGFGPGRKSVTVTDLRLTQSQSSRWRRLAELPDEPYREYLERARAAGEVTESGALEAARAWLAAGKAERLAGRAADLATLGVFAVLLADPPWQEAIPRSASRAIPYPTMPLDLIKRLRVPAADDAVLWLWALPHMLPEALEVMDAWGFRYRSGIVWEKPSPGMGKWVRQQHEHLLIGARGAMSPPLPPNRAASVVHAPRGEHSAKPAEFYDLIETAHPGLPRCELFARQRRPAGRRGATSWPGSGSGQRSTTRRCTPAATRGAAMTDARLPERWLNDRRILRLPDDAFRLHITGLVWCVANRSEGVIFDDDLELLPRVRPAAAAHLAQAGLWTREEDGGYWLIGDFEETQTTKAQLEHLDRKRHLDRERQRRKRERDAAVPRDVTRDDRGQA
jgi:N6-adenosine-specific RNA methylase IME4